jgi:hypothetical protein
VDVSMEMIGVLVAVMEGDVVMAVELVLLRIKWVSNQGSVIKIKHQCFSLRGYVTNPMLIYNPCHHQ